jgi:hypothetical protein
MANVEAAQSLGNARLGPSPQHLRRPTGFAKFGATPEVTCSAYVEKRQSAPTYG